MASRPPAFRPRLAALVALAALLGACGPNPGAALNQTPAKESRTSAKAGAIGLAIFREADGAARIAGKASGPAGLVGANIVSNNSSGILANNAARVVGGNGAGIVASNAGRYALSQLGYREEPIANALVYLTDPEERFFAKDREPIAATTGYDGAYTIPDGIPTDQVAIVNVILSDNRREVGFVTTKAGENKVDVSLATTYVTEFMRNRAGLAGKKMGNYDLTKLGQLTDLTAKALKAADLPIPDLGIGKIADMNHAYALAVGLNKQGLGDAWAAVLGQRVVAMTTAAGSGDYGIAGDGGPALKAEFQKPIGVARGADGAFYMIDEGAHVIRKVTPDGKVSLFAGSGRPTFEGDGGSALSASLNWPRTAAFGPDGQLYVADTLNQRVRKIDPQAGTITTFAGSPQMAGGVPLNGFGGDGGPALGAGFAGLRGMAFATDGTLYLADSWDQGGQSWHHIRRVKPDGMIDTIVGVDNLHGFNGDGKPGRETQVDFVNQLAVDTKGNLYFADARNHRVRRWDATTGLVSTVAGSGTDGKAGDGGAATKAQLSNPYGLALDLKTDPPTMFIAERGSRRVRAVGPDGTIRTIAGGGEKTIDGEAVAMAMNEPVELLLEPDGNLVIADSRGAKLRRLWLRWGF